MSDIKHICTVDDRGVGGRYEVLLVNGCHEVERIDDAGVATRLPRCDFCCFGGAFSSAIESALTQALEPMGCGHPVACVVSNGPPDHSTNHCGACAQLSREVAKAVAAEREACLNLIGAIRDDPENSDEGVEDALGAAIDAIRARGDQR